MSALDTTESIERLFEKLKVDAVFGKPVREGDVTIIPVAEVGVGFGFGSGQTPTTEEQGEEEGDGSEGGGGGAGGKATPRGFIKITSDGVFFESTMDESRVALAGIAFSAWSVFWIAKTIRAFVK